MDMLAKRAGVTALVLIVSAGTALGFGLFQMASSLDERAAHDGPGHAPPPVVAAIQVPDVIITTFEGATPLPEKSDAAKAKLARAPQAAQGTLVNRPKPSVAPMRVAAAAPAPAAEEAPKGTTLDGLDVGLGMKARDRGLDDRGSKAFAIRQMGGAEQLRKPSMGGERITFETDLGRPDR